ncbi:MAG: dethiobiotin synthase [Nocardioidaceae bacterium]
MTFVVVTGTGTGVGKTVATAALACALRADGLAVGVVKPVQTGTDVGLPTDVETVRSLTGCLSTYELVRLGEPLAPDTAATRAGVTIPAVADLVPEIVSIGAAADVTLVEGAGGVLVRLDQAGGTLADLACALRRSGATLTVVTVTTLQLGTLNQTELTVEALRRRGLEPAGIVLGSFPAAPELAETCNVTELPRVTGLPVLASIPAGAGGWSRERFVAEAPGWVAVSALLAPDRPGRQR